MDTKIRCILLDDENPGLAYLRMLCEQIDELEVVRAFNDPLKFIEEIEQLGFDLCILDIEMPGLNGLQVAHLLEGKAIIFCTAYKEFAADAFDLQAIDYIRKPIQKDRLEKAISRAEKAITENRKNKDYITLNTDKGKAILLPDEICHISTAEKDKRDKVVLMRNHEKILVKNLSFKELLQILPKGRFCRINKKDIIALSTVKFYTYDLVTTSIPSRNNPTTQYLLSDSFKEDFKRCFNSQ